MQAYLAILRYDVGQLVRSWLVRIWVLMLVVPALFLVAVASNEQELASETMAAYVAAVLGPFSALAVAMISAGGITGESGIIADSILSRSVTRTEYMSAKITARLGFTLGVYLAVMLPFAYLVTRYAHGDTSPGGVAAGLVMIAALLLFLAGVGMALSTVLSNVLLGAAGLLIGVLVSGLVFQFLGVSWLSTTAVVEGLPETFRGETAVWDPVRVVLVFTGLTAAAAAVAVWVFRRRDL